MLKNSILSSISGQDSKLYADDVFSTWLRTGTGADATITTSIDMTKGYCLWSKSRSAATDHALYHSARGLTLDLATNTTAGQTTQATGLKAVSATGHTIGTLTKINTSAAIYVDWIFRNADKFYSHQVVTKSAGSNATVNFANLGALGMVRVKRTDSTGSWYIWHRSLSAGQLLIGETTAAAATLGHVTVSGTTVTLVNGVIADGTYLVEAFAHDSSADGIIQCGSFTTDGSGNATVNLGWEPQFVLFKSSSGASDWWMVDSMRGLVVDPNTGGDMMLRSNSSAAEISSAFVNPSSTGFSIQGWTSSPSSPQTSVYLAIRRPNKPPTTGTQVYNAIARTGTGAAATSSAGFPVDLVITKKRSSPTLTGARFIDRLRGKTNWLDSSATTVETSTADTVTGLDSMTGVALGADATTSAFNTNSHLYVDEFFRRAPGFMDVVCYTGTGIYPQIVKHSLGVQPEFVITKGRNDSTSGWWVGVKSLGTFLSLYLSGNNKAGDVSNAVVFANTNATDLAVSNYSGVNYIAYLFATLPGISKVGSYTGNGGTQSIPCGFTTGARFVLIKRTDSTGDWYIWDTVRGIVAANDPHLSLNTKAAEVTTGDSIDPDASGFIVNQNAATNINVNLASYIFLAIA